MIKEYTGKLPPKHGYTRSSYVRDDILAFVESGMPIAEIVPNDGDARTAVSTYFNTIKRIVKECNFPYGVEVKAHLRDGRAFLVREDLL